MISLFCLCLLCDLCLAASGLLEYVNNVPIVRDMDKQEFAPSNMMLYDQDTKMLLLNPNNKGQVYEMDLEVGY